MRPTLHDTSFGTAARNYRAARTPGALSPHELLIPEIGISVGCFSVFASIFLAFDFRVWDCQLGVEARPNSGRAFCFGDGEGVILASLVTVQAALRSFTSALRSLRMASVL